MNFSKIRPLSAAKPAIFWGEKMALCESFLLMDSRNLLPIGYNSKERCPGRHHHRVISLPPATEDEEGNKLTSTIR